MRTEWRVGYCRESVSVTLVPLLDRLSVRAEQPPKEPTIRSLGVLHRIFIERGNGAGGSIEFRKSACLRAIIRSLIDAGTFDEGIDLTCPALKRTVWALREEFV